MRLMITSDSEELGTPIGVWICAPTKKGIAKTKAEIAIFIVFFVLLFMWFQSLGFFVLIIRFVFSSIFLY